MRPIDVSLIVLHAATSDHIADARELFSEYASSLDVDLCFQGFEQELNYPANTPNPRVASYSRFLNPRLSAALRFDR